MIIVPEWIIRQPTIGEAMLAIAAVFVLASLVLLIRFLFWLVDKTFDTFE